MVILFSIFFLSPWVSLLLVIAGILFFRNFYEAIAAGVLIDLLYGIPLAKFLHIEWIATFFFLGAYVIVNYVKQYTRFYESV